jgi:pilus assembly protein CpaC
MKLTATSNTAGDTVSPATTINTTITVRDRQSAAFGGIISKSSSNDYGLPIDPKAIITLTAAKGYRKNGGNFVVFVTPIIKSSASAGVEQVKKKFRLKE